MARYAKITNGVVENVEVWATNPGAGYVQSDTAGPGDTYSAGVFTPRQKTVLETRADAAAQRLISSRARLQAIRDQAQSASTGGAFASLAAASTAIRALAGGVADLAQNILDLELVAAYQQDNGTD